MAVVYDHGNILDLFFGSGNKGLDMRVPHFKFYPNDFLGGVAYFTMQERGAYITLLCFQWDSGPIPKKRLGFLLGSDWESLWATISVKFEENEFSEVYNERLEDEREKSAQFIEKQILNGKKGGRPKTQSKPNPKPKSQPKKKAFDNGYGNGNGIGNKGGAGGSLHPVNPDLMGFKGKCRVWLEDEKNYIWDQQDDFAIDDLERKIKEVHRRAGMPTDKEALYGTFIHLIEKLPEWVRENKFSLDYINQKFNEVTNAINSNKQSGKKGSAPISDQDEARLRALLESGALLGVD